MTDLGATSCSSDQTRSRTAERARQAAAAAAQQQTSGATAAQQQQQQQQPQRARASDDVQSGSRQVAAVGEAAAARRATAAAPAAEPTSAQPAAAAEGTHELGSRTLRRGSQGDDVKALQERLNAHGARPPLDVDGKFGPKTQAATRAFQREQGLSADGVSGARTREALKKDGTDGVHGPTPPASGSAIDRNKAAAQALLDNPNVKYWGGLSTGSDRKALEQIARTGQVTVPHTGRTITPKPEMMEALQKMAEAGPLQINALTGGTHSTNSNHYRGTAVDLANGLSARQMAIARAAGGRKNNETSHAHIDF